MLCQPKDFPFAGGSKGRPLHWKAPLGVVGGGSLLPGAFEVMWRRSLVVIIVLDLLGW